VYQGQNVQRKTYGVIVWNIVGGMEKPLVTGKAGKQRWFKNLKINNLPVIWRNNKKKSLDDCS
jgi:hypothetical protein